MKRYILVFAILFGASAAHSQSANAEMPMSKKFTETAKRLTQEEFSRISAAKFKNPRDYSMGINLYQDGDVLVAYSENQLKPNETYSFEEKLNFYKSSEKRRGSSVKLAGHEYMTVHGRKVLIVNYDVNGDEFYTFFSDVYDNNKYIMGHLQFVPADHKRAKQTLTALFSEK